MGQFDDLIPNKKKDAPKGAPTNRFADLLPQAKASFGDVNGAVDSTEGAATPSLMDSLRIDVGPEYRARIEAAKALSAQEDASGETARRKAAQAKREFQEYNPLMRGVAGAGSRVQSLVQGGAQLAAPLVDKLYGTEQGLSGLITGDSRGKYERMADDAVAKTRLFNDSMEGDTAASAGKIVGDIGLLAGPGGIAAKLPGMGRYLGAAGLGAAYGGAQSVGEGESRGTNALTGGALGVAGQGASDVMMAGGGALIKAFGPRAAEIWKAAKAKGIELTPAQLTDSPFLKRLGLMLDNQPLSGSAGRVERQTDAFGKQLAKTIGQDADRLDSNVMRTAYEDLGNTFDDVFDNGVTYDREFLKDLAALRRDTVEQMDDSAVNTINGLVSRVQKQGSQGQLTGKTLKSLDQKARKAATGGGDRQQVAQAFREALHNNFSRNAPTGKKEMWDTARRQYSNYKTLEPLVARSPDGVGPAQLQGAVNSTGKGRARMARGEAGELGELAAIGQRLKGPNTSGTAENLGVRDWNNPLAWPLLLGKSAVSAGLGRGAVNNPSATGLLMQSGGVGKGLQRLAPYAQRGGLLGINPAQDWVSKWFDDPNESP